MTVNDCDSSNTVVYGLFIWGECKMSDNNYFQNQKPLLKATLSIDIFLN